MTDTTRAVTPSEWQRYGTTVPPKPHDNGGAQIMITVVDLAVTLAPIVLLAMCYGLGLRVLDTLGEIMKAVGKR